MPLSEIAKLVNIGTLFAFLIVNIGVIVLRRTAPDMERSFRVPLVPWFPIIGGALCIYLMTKLEARDLAAVLRLARRSASSSTSCTGVRTRACSAARSRARASRRRERLRQPAWSSRSVEHRVH